MHSSTWPYIDACSEAESLQKVCRLGHDKMIGKAWKGPLCNLCQHRSRLGCTSLQSDLNILCLSTYTTVSIDSEADNKGQDQPAQMRRLIRACVVCSLHKGPFHVLHIKWSKFALFWMSASVDITILMSYIFWMLFNSLFIWACLFCRCCA